MHSRSACAMRSTPIEYADPDPPHSDGQAAPAVESSTITARRRELVAFARKAVQIGIPIQELHSLAALLYPDRVERVLEAYWGPHE